MNSMTVHFRHHDMISDQGLFGFDIIFCRNVAIYFDQKLQEKGYMNFYDSLNEGGYFLMGKQRRWLNRPAVI
jgi:chemotaxis protein methyltransferase CheR